MMFENWLDIFFKPEERTHMGSYFLAVRSLVIYLFWNYVCDNKLPYWCYEDYKRTGVNQCLIIVSHRDNGDMSFSDFCNDEVVYGIFKSIFKMDLRKYIRVEVSIDKDCALEEFNALR